MNIPAKIETDETICQCFQVNESTIRAAIEKDNLTEIEQVTEKCEAGGGCHSCHILLQLFIDEYQKKNDSHRGPGSGTRSESYKTRYIESILRKNQIKAFLIFPKIKVL